VLNPGAARPCVAVHVHVQAIVGMRLGGKRRVLVRPDRGQASATATSTATTVLLWCRLLIFVNSSHDGADRLCKAAKQSTPNQSHVHYSTAK
jgi:hypothetical protein